MLRKSVQEFINEQRNKIEQEKIKLAGLVTKKENCKKNDPEILIRECDFISGEKENIPTKEIYLQEDAQKMLKYGEFSPNNPKMRVATQPYLGLGEYEQRKHLLLQQRKAEYQQYSNQVRRASDQDNAFIKNNLKGSRPVSNRDKAVQTDIQNVHTQLIQCDLPGQKIKEKSPRSRGVKIDKVQIETQNNIIIPGHNKYQARFNANSPRAKLMADLQSSYFPTLMGYATCTSTTQDVDKLEKVRRQEKYLAELRQQIEEKQQLLQKHKEQEKLEQELTAKRLDSLSVDDKPVLGKSYSVDAPFTDRISMRNTRNAGNINSKYTVTNSPPLNRRNNPPYSFNIPANSVFAKRNTMNNVSSVQNNSLTTKPTRMSRVSKTTDTLPIPVLKAPSPVAKELVNAVPVAMSTTTSDAMKNLEAKWQIPAVQKNVEDKNEGILTQLGAIRLQLQQEQLRLDETLKTRGMVQTVADVHQY